MKAKFKNYWIIITLIIVANVAIFFHFSKKLEVVVANYTYDEVIQNN